ncbi:MAG TPA: 50S ribosomal protein L9 [Candidatus Kapabacteria bacterium]|jgi:large subunit ribosomal protein L9|nr:50S ribosomal protein L9 [Candidatus Kapabacteria bacterium]HOM04107.1 50S ribosomal protein L9 [Candidatus Kapabacteria bacterium]HOQ49010.1 50S ribosomal protein L9 [Candidatus Kapabacteria bacterium]HPU24292.1 50S ribosomal protein L9 [Candidatus Kapabacteria bacterium]
MKIILREDIAKLGKIGDVVNVRDGYARNFLLPKGLAFVATEGAMKRIEALKRSAEKRSEKERQVAEQIAAKIADVQITIPMKVGEEGKLYGSVSQQMIANELQARGFDIDKRNVILEDPIKTLGIFDVKIKLHSEVIPTLKVWVINEEQE